MAEPSVYSLFFLVPRKDPYLGQVYDSGAPRALAAPTAAPTVCAGLGGGRLLPELSFLFSSLFSRLGTLDSDGFGGACNETRFTLLM